MKHLLPLDAQVTFYNALIRPLFDFADTIWGERDNITLMHDLQVLQNRNNTQTAVTNMTKQRML